MTALVRLGTVTGMTAVRPDPPLAHVVTVSDRSAAGLRADLSGPLAAGLLQDAGFEVSRSVVPDGADAVARALRDALALGARLVVTSGGTGVGPRDRTPEGTRPVVDRELPGLMELVRARGGEHSPHAYLSRGIAGTLDATAGHAGALVVNLPGKPDAVREGLQILLPLVPHLLDQLAGGDH